MSSSELANRVAENIARLREAHGMSQTQLGSTLGLSQQHISKKLQGRHEFSLDELERLAETFGVSPESLLAPSSA